MENLKNDKNFYDLIIIGSGSAGMSAGIYSGRARLRTLIIERDLPGGQVKITAEVVNYPGIENISGADLSLTMKKQAKNFGVEFVDADVTSVDFSGTIKRVTTTAGEFSSLGIIVATGAEPRSVGFEGEKEFMGRGIGFCATCDGQFFTGLDVFVVGGGFAAAEESVFLTRFAKKVTIIVRGDEFTCSKAVAEKALNNPKIEVKFNTEMLAVSGERTLKKARFKNNKTGEEWEYTASEKDGTFGVFLFVGYSPLNEPFKGVLTMDEHGYIITDENMKTNVEGVYAAGDIRPKILRQLVTAAADGAIASTSVERYIEEKRHELGLKRDEPHEESAETVKHFFDDELKSQLKPILERFETKIIIKAVLDGGKTSAEIKSFLTDFAELSDKVSVEIYGKGENEGLEAEIKASYYPVFGVYDSGGKFTGIKFNGVPGGHEINSFIIALYNTAGPGQQISAETLDKLASIDKKAKIQVGISLSCTLCPEVVMASQLIALKNSNVEAEMIDVANYSEFKNEHSIMSVPAIVINGGDVIFGKKSLDELVELVKKA